LLITAAVLSAAEHGAEIEGHGVEMTMARQPKTLAEAIVRIGELKARLQPFRATKSSRQYCELGQTVVDLGKETSLRQLGDSSASTSREDAKLTSKFAGGMATMGAHAAPLVMKLLGPAIKKTVPKGWKRLIKTTVVNLLEHKAEELVHKIFFEESAKAGGKSCGNWLKAKAKDMPKAWREGLPAMVAQIMNGNSAAASNDAGRIAMNYADGKAQRTLERDSKLYPSEIAPHVRNFLLSVIQTALVNSEDAPASASASLKKLGEDNAKEKEASSARKLAISQMKLAKTKAAKYKPLGFAAEFFDSAGKFAGAALPPLIDRLVKNLPAELKQAQEPMRETLKGLSRDITAELEVYPVPDINKAAIVEYCISAAKEFEVRFGDMATSLAQKVLLRRLTKPLSKLPEELQPILRDTMTAIGDGDPEGAAAKMPSLMANYGVKTMLSILSKVGETLPEATGGVVSNTISSIIKEYKPTAGDSTRRLGESLGSIIGGLPVVDLRTVLIKQGIKLVFGLLPQLLDKMLKGMPHRLADEKESIETTMMLLIMRLGKILNQMDAKWNLEGRTEMANAIVYSVYDLAVRLEEKSGSKVAERQEDVFLDIGHGDHKASAGALLPSDEHFDDLGQSLEDDSDSVEEDETPKSNAKVMLKPIFEKIPVEYRSMFTAVLPNLLGGKISQANSALQTQLLSIGLIEIPKTIDQGMHDLPEFMNIKIIKKAIVKVVITYAEALEKVLRPVSASGEKGDDPVAAAVESVDSVELLMVQGVKILEGVLPGAIKHLADNLPPNMKPLQDPLKQGFTTAIETILNHASQPKNWNAVGYTTLAKKIVEAAKDLKQPFAMARAFRHRANLLKRVKPLLTKLQKSTHTLVLETLELAAVGDFDGAAEEMKRGMGKVLVEKVKAVAERDSAKLPGFAGPAVKKAVLDITDKDVAPGSSAAFVGKVIIEDIVMVVGQTLPTVISLFIDKVPKIYWKVKSRLKTILGDMSNKICALLGRGPVAWNRFTGAKIVKVLVGGFASIKKNMAKFVDHEEVDDTPENESIEFLDTGAAGKIAATNTSSSSTETSAPTPAPTTPAPAPKEKISKTIHHLTGGLPPELSGMLDDVIKSLEDDDTPSAEADLDKQIIEFGIAKIEDKVSKMTSKLPGYFQDAVFNSFTNVLKEEATQLDNEDAYLTNSGFEIGDSKDDFNPGKMLLENGIVLIGGILPGLIEKMVEHLPRGLRHKKVPVRQELTKAVRKIMAVIGSGEENWSEKGAGAVVEILIRTAKSLHAHIESVKEKLKVVKKIRSDIYAMPKEFVVIFRDAVESLVAGDAQGAVVIMDKQITNYGVKQISEIVHDFTSKLPKFASKPVEKAITTIMLKQASMMGVNQELGEAEKLGGFVGIATLLIGETVHLLKQLLPPLIISMTTNLPERLAGAGMQLRTALTNMCNDVLDVLSQGAEMWGEKGANDIAVLVVRHSKKMVAAAANIVAEPAASGTKGTEQTSTTAKEDPKVEKGDLGQQTPDTKPPVGVMSVTSSGPQLIPRGMLVKVPSNEESEVHEIGALGESADVQSALSKEDPEEVIAPLFKKLPHEFRTMMEMTLTKILIKEPAQAGEEMKKGISEYAQSKIGRTVKDMMSRLPRFMQGPAERALMSVINQQAKEFAGEAAGFDPTAVALGAVVELLRGVLPGAIKRMTHHLAFEKAQNVLRDALDDIVQKILQILQRGPWDTAAKVQIIDEIVGSAKSLLDNVKKAMGGKKKAVTDGDDDTMRQIRLLL